MEVVIPQRIQPVSSVGDRTDDAYVLRFVLGDQDDVAPPRGSPRPRSNRGHQMVLRPVVNARRGVESQSVEVILVNAEARGARKILAHRPGIGTIEIEGLSPLVLVA